MLYLLLQKTTTTIQLYIDGLIIKLFFHYSITNCIVFQFKNKEPIRKESDVNKLIYGKCFSYIRDLTFNLHAEKIQDDFLYASKYYSLYSSISKPSLSSSRRCRRIVEHIYDEQHLQLFFTHIL